MLENQKERKLKAFYVFATDGLERVKQLFPDEVEFVLANAQRDYDTVKTELTKTDENNNTAV